jgi:G3E family GTPase
MKIHLLSGFLGSGKTTAIQHAASMLIKQGASVGVITNDQGIQLVDTNYFNVFDIPNRQVINGCFCCNYRDLDTCIDSLKKLNDAEIIFAESVGSCTDIIATVLKPLLQFRPDDCITLSTFADVRLLKMMLSGNTSFNETIRYIYLKQLEEASVIVVNKIDLVDADELQMIKHQSEKKYGNKILLYQNSLDDISTKKWLQIINEESLPASLWSLDIDYDIYAAGEASLAWFDQSVQISNTHGTSMQSAENLINTIFKKITELQYTIGHLKFLVNDAVKISLTSANELPVKLPPADVEKATLLINIRVETTPEKITQLIEGAIKETELMSGCKISTNNFSAFAPGYPKPVHRILNEHL